ncbi:MAG: hypothetical protein PHW18_00610 [Sulfuricurvum sp.]|uniref:hypothetical protein n=1 Tax=Sulfuricurvum sp. TaxID=2025608 RepID=UPI0026173699|nr:hypothetical protein [Sulfuricurvum sp.]MDD2828057.1 hypothetical protein [Sulfuricurvum sp.]MDD4948066.1 hypothetical protein [Sulfuricurvum sp.]
MFKIVLNLDFRYAAINQTWRLFSGLALLALIPLYLNAETQGYWYTFTSLAALAVFADMGFSTILLQFSAHEFAHLKFESDKTLSGNHLHLERIASLLRFAMKWSWGIGLLTFPIILFSGFVILSQKYTTVLWGLPWIIYVMASVLAFINSILLSFIEGCNSVGEVQKIRFLISFITIISTVIFLMIGSGLYALTVSLCIGTLSGTMLIFYRYARMLKQLHGLGTKISHSWKYELLPLMGKYAISWASGYFIFFIFTPIAFHYYGAVEAGKVGLSIAVCTAIYGISNIWITIITPKINILVAHQDYETLDFIFKKHLSLAILTYMLVITVLFIAVIFLGKYLHFADRLVNPFSLTILSLSWLMQITINSLALYIRAHKEEPLAIPSFISGVYITTTTWLIALYLPFEYFFIAFLSSYLWGIPWVIMIFKKYRKRDSVL